MMLIAIAASVLIASSALAAAPAAAPPSVPPLLVNVVASDDVAPQLVRKILKETDAIWRAAGVTISWHLAARAAAPLTGPAAPGPYIADVLRLNISNGNGSGRDGKRPLGWIVFDDETRPQREIYLSRSNAAAMLEEARGVVGNVDEMPTDQRETLLGRAMGRALAHEIGHYLLTSKVHTRRGLMKAVMTAVELFMPDAGAFRIDQAQRHLVAERLRSEPLVAAR
jgi:hypothetical protein